MVTAAAVVVGVEKEVRAVYIPRTNLNVILAIQHFKEFDAASVESW